MKDRIFKNLLKEHKNRVYSYALYFLHNREDAEDITQEVFIRVWKYQDRIRGKTVVPWLMKVTHNCCIDCIRKRKSERRNNYTESMDEFDTISSDLDNYSSPESSYELSEMQKELLNALQTLPDKTRSMILLHYFQGMRFDEIGEIFGTKSGTVKVAVHRGRKMLREILKEQFVEKRS